MLRGKWPDGNIGVDTWHPPPYDHRMNDCRLAKSTDAAAIRAIYEPIVRETAISFEYEVPSIEEIESRMRKVMDFRPWLVFEQSGEVLGYAYASTFRDRRAYDWGVEVSIYVRSDAHGRGIGRTLYSTLFDLLRAQNYCQAIAGATMPNEGSERLHLSMGFKEIACFPNIGYKFGRWHDVVFWSLPLRELPAVPTPLININELTKSSEWAWLIKS